MRQFTNHIIYSDCTIRNALEALHSISEAPDTVPMNLFIVNKKNQIVGSLTDGDIRRGLLSGYTLDDNVKRVMNADFNYLEKGQCNLHKIREFRNKEINLIPLLDSDKVIRDILDLRKKKSLLPVDAILMAGGEGKRLQPLTNTTPKPLLKVGEKEIIDYIIDRFDKYGIPNLTLSVRYMADQIIDHIHDCKMKWDLSIDFIREKKPMGTIGALSLINDFKHDTILLSNADLLSTINYESFYEYFIETSADVAVASIPYNVKIPYGIFETNGTKILSIQEKPEYSYYSNAGIYLIKPELLSLIPENQFFDVTDFLKCLINKNYKVVYYRMLGYWQDIGNHEDFKKVQKDINLIDV